MSPASTRLGGSSGNGDIQTPHYLYDWADRRFAFTFDAMASHANHLAPRYSTLEGTFERHLFCECSDRQSNIKDCFNLHKRPMISPLDGLRYPWSGERVFVNPPFGRGLLLPAVRKMVDERNEAEIIVCLIKVDTSTAWWRLLEAHAHIEWMPRIRFDNPADPNWPAATFPCALAIFVPDAPRMPTRKRQP